MRFCPKCGAALLAGRHTVLLDDRLVYIKYLVCSNECGVSVEPLDELGLYARRMSVEQHIGTVGDKAEVTGIAL